MYWTRSKRESTDNAGIMRWIPFVAVFLVEVVTWKYHLVSSFRLGLKEGNLLFRKAYTSCNLLSRKSSFRSKGETFQQRSFNLFIYHNEVGRNGERGGKNRDDTIFNRRKEREHVMKDIQGVWKFYLPTFIMDTNFETAKGEESYEGSSPGDADEAEDFQVEEKATAKESENEESDLAEDESLNILRGERMLPLSLFVYNQENIVSGSNFTYAYWSNDESTGNNIYDCTVKIINKMNSKYMIILQGYLFVSKVNALKDRNIRLMPCQLFANLFLANSDNVMENTLIPPNMKVYDKNGNEVKDVMSILEKKIPEFKKDKKKINSILGLRKWKFLGVSTAYKVVGEGKNMFNINHFLTKKDEKVFYTIMDFDMVNKHNYKNGIEQISYIFNEYFEMPSNDILFQMKKKVH
ncbi:conserved Plasmodium protein, unknown function [Plasmodium ovale wallikeri]|uniref:Uncharacterized protein n=1 Tax=Plasmodium ovale wallikeri TaxID=864142 RepID=A0A1A8YH12_PLAOA|nr:conserved Plasmodium protein, unknown function [Plasmodium ovale wallikeri]